MPGSPEFWVDKRVLVTGHTGFKGGWIALWLSKWGAQVCGFALEPPTTPSLFDVASVDRDIKSVMGDIRNLSHLTEVISDFRPQIIIHMAAQSLVRHGYQNPVETYATNVLGTVHVLEAARRVEDVRVILNVTSDKCYENREWLWAYREVDDLGGRDPYSNSKACAELVTEAYRRSFYEDPQHSGTASLSSVRAGNVIGGGDWSTDRLIPDIIRAFAAGRTVKIRNPKAVRPWQHVLEPLSGYMLLAERLWNEGISLAGAWNFGPPAASEQPVGWIVDRVAQLWGDEARWEHDQDLHPAEAGLLKLDSSKAQAELGYIPRLAIEPTLEWVVEWYRAYDSGSDMRALTFDQIDRFEALGRP